MTPKELRHHDIITPARRRKPGRNLTNDITNGVLAFIILMMVIGGLLML